MKRFFEKIFRRKGEKPREILEVEQSKIQEGTEAEPKKTKTIVEIGLDVLQALEIPEEEEDALFESIRRHRRFFQEDGALFVSVREAEFFLEMVKAMHTRPFEIIDLTLIQEPFETLKRLIEKYENASLTPIIFVLNSDPERLNQIDPDWNFDAALRHQLQYERWSIFLTGRPRFGRSGSFAPSAANSPLYYAEEQRKRSEKSSKESE